MWNFINYHISLVTSPDSIIAVCLQTSPSRELARGGDGWNSGYLCINYSFLLLFILLFILISLKSEHKQFCSLYFFFRVLVFYYMERHCKWFSTKSLSSFFNTKFSNRFFWWQNNKMFQDYFSFNWFCQQQSYVLFQRNIVWAKAMTEGYSIFKVVQNSFQHFPSLEFWCFIKITKMNESQTEKGSSIIIMTLLFHFYVILTYKVKRRRKMRGRNTL